ncbi:hypothetical protein [Cerasicoccus arenae]|uniref:Uncharacterized protein n=1 Tax=Cerasicoccus arenae TaxID=424488 RepID=A0A8J3GBT9_9BACT|nr:hypothetical protein [Cerasicoccus arenae]MBK1856898.1 hypothetical protein [Cerasicoccus arenae]GHB89731.1 hypothetical protein GCM10007047_00230 [Cerasicoccus arenae]
MGILGILVTVLLFLFALWAITLCLRIGASWAGISKSKNTIGRALIALILSSLVLGLLGGGGTILPGVGNVIGVLISLIINGVIIGGVYGVPFGKGVQVYVLALVAQIALVLLAILIFGLLGITLVA